MKKFFLFAILSLSLSLVSCTQQTSTYFYGGKMTINLDPGQKLENITWKTADTSSSLWILTSPRPANENPKMYTFKESSNLGLMEGVVYIQEQ